MYRVPVSVFYGRCTFTNPGETGRIITIFAGGGPIAPREKEYLSMKRFISLLLVLTVMASLLVACGNKEEDSSSTQPVATAEPTPTPTPEPPYDPNPLTGEAKDADYNDDVRLTAVMVNNICQARPQRGLSQAEMLFEIKVEGGITRFMAVFQDYEDIQEVGPVRSARDQFFQLIVHWEPLYIHDGESVVQSQYIQATDYYELNSKNAGNGYRDRNRTNWAGNYVDYEHTEYTDAEHIQQYIDNNSTPMEFTYNNPDSYNYFNWLDYRYDSPRQLTDGSALDITIEHSQSYRTAFSFDEASGQYVMSQYYYPNGGSWMETVDELNGETLKFTNVFVLAADIYTYPGHEAKDLQCVDYAQGGTGYYFYNGNVEKVYWEKGQGAAHEPITLYHLNEDGTHSSEEITVNLGKCYIAVIDNDETASCTYTGNDPVVEEPAEGAADGTQEAADTAAESTDAAA